MKEMHTAKNMKKELFIQSPEKAGNLLHYQLHRDRSEVMRSARERVGKILATHRPEQVDADTKSKMDKILAKHQRR